MSMLDCINSNPIANCLTYSTGGLCSDFSCQINCMTCEKRGYYPICAQCNGPYTVLNAKESYCEIGKCCSDINNCVTYDYDSCLCSSCQQNFFLTNDFENCCPFLDNCQTYSNCGCIACQPNFIINSDNSKCCNSLNNCLIYNSECTCCQTNNNCLSYNSDCTCFSCISDYIIENNVCCPLVSNCGNYGSNCLCSSCLAGYISFNDSNNCCMIIESCDSPSSDCTCKSCLLGHVLNSDSTSCCLPISNCLTYKSDCSCETCGNADIFDISNSTCCPLILNCNSYLPNCLCDIDSSFLSQNSNGLDFGVVVGLSAGLGFIGLLVFLLICCKIRKCFITDSSRAATQRISQNF